MIYRIVCNVVADGLTEPEVAEILAPELRGLVVSTNGAHSWRSLFEISADTDLEAYQKFGEIFARKVGDLRISYCDEEARKK